MRGNGTRFIVISFRSTFSEPSNRAELSIQKNIMLIRLISEVKVNVDLYSALS